MIESIGGVFWQTGFSLRLASIGNQSLVADEAGFVTLREFSTVREPA